MRTLLALALGAEGRPRDEERGVAEAMGFLASDEGRGLHQLLPPILQELSRRDGLARLDEDLRAELMGKLGEGSRIDMHQERWVARVADAAITRGLPMILLKGAAFRRTLYDEHAPRLGVDVDLLVRPEQRGAFEALLQDLGAKRHLPFPDHMATADSLFERVYRTPPGSGREGEPRRPSVVIELHDALTKPHGFSIDHDALWERSVPNEGTSDPLVRRLSAEDSLCFLAIHAHRHGTAPAHSVVDAARLLARWPWKLDALLGVARSWGATTVLHAFLRQVAHWTKAPGLTDALAQSRPGAARRFLLERLWPAERSLLHLEDRPRLRQLLLLGLLDRPLAPLASLRHVASLRLADSLERRKRS